MEGRDRVEQPGPGLATTEVGERPGERLDVQSIVIGRYRDELHRGVPQDMDRERVGWCFHEHRVSRPREDRRGQVEAVRVPRGDNDRVRRWGLLVSLGQPLAQPRDEWTGT